MLGYDGHCSRVVVAMADFSSLFSLGYDFCFSWGCRGPFCDEVHHDQWVKKMTSWRFIIICFS
jgi:hypothetical protein